MYPPSRVCLDPRCIDKKRGGSVELAQFISTRTVLFTSEWGPIPAWSYSGKCPRTSRYYLISACMKLTPCRLLDTVLSDLLHARAEGDTHALSRDPPIRPCRYAYIPRAAAMSTLQECNGLCMVSPVRLYFMSVVPYAVDLLRVRPGILHR